MRASIRQPPPPPFADLSELVYQQFLNIYWCVVELASSAGMPGFWDLQIGLFLCLSLLYLFISVPSASSLLSSQIHLIIKTL